MDYLNTPTENRPRYQRAYGASFGPTLLVLLPLTGPSNCGVLKTLESAFLTQSCIKIFIRKVRLLHDFVTEQKPSSLSQHNSDAKTEK